MTARTIYKVLDCSFGGVQLEGLTRASTICEYRSDTDSSGQLIDYSGKAHHLTKTGTIGTTQVNMQDMSGNKIRTPYYPSGANYFSCAHHADFNFWDSDFTLTSVFCPDSSASTGYLFCHGADNTNGGYIYYNATSQNVGVTLCKSGSSILKTAASSYAAPSPIIVQVCRSSNSVYIFLNGTSSTVLDATGYGIDGSGAVYIGSYNGGTRPGLSVPYLRIDAEALSTDELAYERDYLTGCTIGVPGIRSRSNSVKSYAKKGWTFTRSTQAYADFNDGSIGLTAANVPRIGNDRALIAGASATNLALQSQTVSEFREVRPNGIDSNYEWYWCASDSDGSNLIVAGSGRLRTSADSGASWTERRPSGADANYSWTGCASDDDGSNLIAVAYGNRLWTSADSGASWTERRPAGDSDYNWRTCASDADGTNLIAGVYSGRLWTSADSGASWTERRPSGADSNYNWRTCASDADGTNLIAGVYSGRLWTSADSGASWTERRPAGDVDYPWACCASDSDGSNLIAIGIGGRVWTSADSGANWTERRPNGVDASYNWHTCASDDDGSTLIASVTGGRLWTSADSGANWTERRPSGADANADWRSCASSYNGNNLIAGVYGGRLYMSAWYKKACTSVSYDGSIASDGTTTMDGPVADATDVTHGITQFQTLTAASYALSVYAKKGDKNWLYLADSTVANCYAYFDVNAGKVGTVGAGCTAKMAPASTGIYRCSITFTGTAAAHTLQAFAANADADNDFTGDAATVNIWLWGFQCGLGKHNTSYIPTTTASASRSADILSVPVTSIGSMPLSMSSTTPFKKLAVEIDAKTYFDSNATSNGDCILFEVSGNSGTAGATRNRIRGVIGSDGYISAVAYDNSSTLFTRSITTINPCTFSDWNTYYFYFDFEQWSNSLIKINAASQTLSSSSGTPTMDLTNCSVRVNNDNTGAAYESAHIRNGPKIWVIQ